MTRVLFGLLAVAFVVSGCTTPQTSDTASAGDGAASGGELQIGSAPQGEVDGFRLDSPEGSLEWVSFAYGDRVFFDYDSASLTAEGAAVVQGWAEWMAMFPDIVVRIEGHCDERGTREYNLALGDKRANAVRNLLIAYGVAPDRIAVVSFGKERPLVAGHDDSSWGQNRRGVLTLI